MKVFEGERERFTKRTQWVFNKVSGNGCLVYTNQAIADLVKARKAQVHPAPPKKSPFPETQANLGELVLYLSAGAGAVGVGGFLDYIHGFLGFLATVAGIALIGYVAMQLKELDEQVKEDVKASECVPSTPAKKDKVIKVDT